MSGGIRFVLAEKNRFSSRHLTYALRLKSNARRGGRVEDIILADSVMEHVQGAAIHGTMLYEDGRSGEDLPVFRNITIEKIRARGGDYGIFLEAFEEVPITGLVLRDIRIDGVDQAMRSMNWEDPVVEDVQINGKPFPRPGKVRILGVPVEGHAVQACAEYCGGEGELYFTWEVVRGETGEQKSLEKADWIKAGEGEHFILPKDCLAVRVTALDQKGERESSRSYRVLSRKEAAKEAEGRKRLICRGMLEVGDPAPDRSFITRAKLAQMLLPLAEPILKRDGEALLAMDVAVACGFFAKEEDGGCQPEGTVTRQEMATVAMQACGVNYRNASSTMPVCADVGEVSDNYGTNVARALYFGFMELDEKGCFRPEGLVTVESAVAIINRVADFAGI